MFIGREPYWQRRFAEEGLPVIGDDIKSQVGATITHRVLTRLFMDRGVRLDRTYQLNFGGNTDFLNMLERERLESKKISKTNAVTSMLDYEIDPDDVHVGPSDHVPWLKDRKWCYIRMEGTTFGDVPLNAELKLEVWDSPNSAGVITDAIRCLKLGLDRGLKGTLVAPSSYFMKSPPIQIHDDIARQPGRGVHPRRGQRDARRHREPDQGAAPQARLDGAGQHGRQEAAARSESGQWRRGPPPARERCRQRGLEALLIGEGAGAADPREGGGHGLRDRASGSWPTCPQGARPLGDRHGQPGRLPRLADEAGLVERELRPGDRPARRTIRAVRRLALARVPRVRPLPRRDDAPRVALGARTRSRRVVQTDLDQINEIWRASPGGLIFVLGHVGNNEAVAAGVADRGWPISVVADDSSLPRDVRALPPAARGVGRPRDPVAEPARDLRGPPAQGDARAPDRLGLPIRRRPGPALRRLDDAAGRARDPRRQDRLGDPAGRDPARRGRRCSTSRSRR